METDRACQQFNTARTSSEQMLYYDQAQADVDFAVVRKQWNFNIDGQHLRPDPLTQHE